MLSLLAPNHAGIDTLWQSPLPFALWPVGPQSLLAHWMDEAVRLGMDEVKIYASDRPAEIRRHLEGGAYWSCKVEVIPLMEDTAAPAEAVRVEHLPGSALESAEPFTPETLLRHWLSLQSQWLRSRESGAVHVDVERSPGGWVGPRAGVHPNAKLVAPYWIGAGAKIGPGCEIGPDAFIGANSVLDGGVQVCEGVVMPGTYLGQNLRVAGAIAQSGLLVDVRRGCRAEVRENFILSSVAQHSAGPSLLERAAATAAWVFAAPLALLWPRQTWTETRITDREGGEIVLKTGSAGPLIVRRWPWLKQIAAGEFCWFGILPRRETDWEHMPAETAQLLRGCPCGLFSWADLEGCHDVGAPDEWIHAAYQVIQKENTVPRMLRRNFLQLALRPL